MSEVEEGLVERLRDGAARLVRLGHIAEADAAFDAAEHILRLEEEKGSENASPSGALRGANLDAEAAAASENLLTDEGVRIYLAAFYERVNYPEPRRSLMTQAFEAGLVSKGHWAPIVLKDLGLEQVRAYRRIGPPSDQREVPQ